MKMTYLVPHRYITQPSLYTMTLLIRILKCRQLRLELLELWQMPELHSPMAILRLLARI